MKTFFEDVFKWLSWPTAGSGNADGVRRPNVSDYDRRLRELEARSGKLFLP
ncbi:MAG TPA: hypothetical protein VMH26_06135 [Burkholderiales bacterium]|nr:hypothetical protein [Burkholderiales bacterium]